MGKRIPKRKTNKMTWEAIKHIYKRVLIKNNRIEYLGGDKYKLTDFYPTGEKYWEREYQNRLLHGKNMGWHENGQKRWEVGYKDGRLHGKNTRWYESGQKHWETEYQNGKWIE